MNNWTISGVPLKKETYKSKILFIKLYGVLLKKVTSNPIIIPIIIDITAMLIVMGSALMITGTTLNK